uniref:Uncharacterized protein n=1 Tax=Anopheles atroparvus TaxID=41427 RepID=A0A182J034_ANOAO
MAAFAVTGCRRDPEQSTRTKSQQSGSGSDDDAERGVTPIPRFGGRLKRAWGGEGEKLFRLQQVAQMLPTVASAACCFNFLYALAPSVLPAVPTLSHQRKSGGVDEGGRAIGLSWMLFAVAYALLAISPAMTRPSGQRQPDVIVLQPKNRLSQQQQQKR